MQGCHIGSQSGDGSIMNVKRTRVIVIMDSSAVGIGAIIFFLVCCVFCAMECEFCEFCAECGRGDAANARDATEGEVVSNPIEV